jgi:hypothetical protein
MENEKKLKLKIDKKLFWDADFNKMDLDDHADFIIKRVLNFGDLKDFEAIKGIYGIKKIKDVANCSIFQNNKTLNFWGKIFEIKCIQKQSKNIQSAFSKR